MYCGCIVSVFECFVNVSWIFLFWMFRERWLTFSVKFENGSGVVGERRITNNGQVRFRRLSLLSVLLWSVYECFVCVLLMFFWFYESVGCSLLLF